MRDDEENPYDLAKLRIDMPSPPTGQKSDVPARRRKRTEPFIQIPLSLMERLASVTAIATLRVAIYLHYQNWKTAGEPITVSNVALGAWGVSRFRKCEALAELETLGLIAVERRGKRAPRVKLL